VTPALTRALLPTHAALGQDRLTEATFEVVDRGTHHLGVVPESAEAATTSEAQQAAIAAGSMIMINVKRATVEADETQLTLPVTQGRDLLLGESVTPLEVVAPHTAVFFRLDLSHRQVVARLAVGGSARRVRLVATELVDRLRLSTMRAVLHALGDSRMAAIGAGLLADRRLLLPVLRSVA
jgi:hypothetical protein